MRSCMHFVGWNFKRLFTSPRPYLTFLLVYVGLDLCFGGARTYLAETGQTVQAVEFYIFANTNRVSQWILALGMLLLLGDAPFWKEGLSLHLIRSSRLQWLLGQILFCILLSALYQWIAALLLAILFRGQISFQNQWSDAITMAARLPNGNAVLQIQMAIDFSMRIIRSGRPYAMFGLTVLYTTLLFSFFSMVLIVCNLRWKAGVGCLAVAAFLGWKLVLEQLLPTSPLRYLSPCSLAALNEQSFTIASILYPVLFFCVACTVLGKLAYKLTKQSDLGKGDAA